MRNDGLPGVTRCLGRLVSGEWCNKQFYSPDKTRIRFCKECAERKTRLEREKSVRVYKVGNGD